MTTVSSRKPRDIPTVINPAAPVHHAIDLDGLTAGDYVTIGGHWYGLTSAESQGTANFGPHLDPPEGAAKPFGPGRGTSARGSIYLKLKLMHCPWLGCPAEDEPADPEPFFEPGKTYLTENRAFEFTCERVVDGVAIGREREFDPRWNPANRRVWHSVMPEGCWTEVAPQEENDD